MGNCNDEMPSLLIIDYSWFCMAACIFWAEVKFKMCLSSWSLSSVLVSLFHSRTALFTKFPLVNLSKYSSHSLSLHCFALPKSSCVSGLSLTGLGKHFEKRIWYLSFEWSNPERILIEFLLKQECIFTGEVKILLRCFRNCTENVRL